MELFDEPRPNLNGDQTINTEVYEGTILVDVFVRNLEYDPELGNERRC